MVLFEDAFYISATKVVKNFRNTGGNRQKKVKKGKI